jgi:hypothetical protein
MEKINIHIDKKDKLKAIRKAEREIFLKDRIGSILTTKISKNKKKYSRKLKHKNVV